MPERAIGPGDGSPTVRAAASTSVPTSSFRLRRSPTPRPQPDNGPSEYVRHPGELAADGRTHVCFEAYQSGLGYINSRGKRPLPEYRLPDTDYTFNFMIRPIGLK